MNCLICTKPNGKLVRLVLTIPTFPIAMCDQDRARWRDRFGIDSVEVTTALRPDSASSLSGLSDAATQQPSPGSGPS